MRRKLTEAQRELALHPARREQPQRDLARIREARRMRRDAEIRRAPNLTVANFEAEARR